jgi:ATPase family associated with various cellular activities (AAA)
MSADDRQLDRSLELVLARVRGRARLRTEWLRTLWRAAEAGPVGATVTHAEVDLSLDDRDNPSDEADWLAHAEYADDRAALAAIETELARDTGSRLSRLCTTFGLSAADRDLLHACLAAELDPSLLRVYAYLQDVAARSYVTDALAARLFGHGRSHGTADDSPLLRWAMLGTHETSPGEQAAYRLDRAVYSWLTGNDALGADLAGIARRVDCTDSLEGWPVADTGKELARWLDDDTVATARVRVIGADGSGRRTFAALVANRFGRALLAVDATLVDESAWPHIERTAKRRALLDGTALALSPPPSFWTKPSAATRPAIALQFVVTDTERALPAEAHTVDYTVVLPPLSIDSRRALWQRHAPWSAGWPAPEFETLVRQHRALPRDIARIAMRGESSPAETGALLRSAARESLGELAQRLECPFGRGDLVVTAHVSDALDDLLFEAHDRVAFWERPDARRLFPQGRGLLALFSGPPGTGKTMSAQVVAATLGMDLFRIDLAAVVSKWVGETSRNLDRLLRRAADLDVVLLFDEADALFGKRTDVKEANDRFANTDTGFLLQAIESYRGVALLSTNRKGDIDPAFVRRLRYVFDFPVPTEVERLQLWRGLVGQLAGAAEAERLSTDLQRLAAGVEVTGAQIKLAVLTALFASRRDQRDVTAGHLMRGLERELAKEGRPVGGRLRERLTSHAR